MDGGLMDEGWMDERTDRWNFWCFILLPVKAAVVLFKEDFYVVWEPFSTDFNCLTELGYCLLQVIRSSMNFGLLNHPVEGGVYAPRGFCNTLT